MGDLSIRAGVKEIKMTAVTFRPCPRHHNMNIADIGECPDCDLTPRDERTVVWKNPEYQDGRE